MNASAAAAIRQARKRAHMTQAQLAARAGVAQSVVSAYESSSREPGMTMLGKLVNAAGFDLVVSLMASTAKSPRRISVDQHRAQLTRALRAHGGRNIRLFGSVARGDDGPESDIDLLVDVGPSVGLFALGRMRADAERILSSAVDIVPSNSLKPDVAERALAEAVPL